MRRFSDFSLKLDRSLSNIFDFSQQILHFIPTKQQAELFKFVQFETFAPMAERIRGKGIFVSSGQGPGKTAASVVCALFRLFQRSGSKVLVTSPTARQVQDVWVNELRRRVSMAPFEFQQRLDIQTKRVQVRGCPGWDIITATATKDANIQGYHDDNLTIIADEASGIPRGIWRVLKGTLTQSNNLLIGIGNPNDRNTEFFDAFHKDRDLYHVANWNSEESPNVDPEHLKKMEQEFGRDSDIYRVRVLGLFPNESPNVVIRHEDLLHACRKTEFFNLFTKAAPLERRPAKQFGIDLARFGGDESVIVARCGSAMVGLKSFTKKEPQHVLQFAMGWQKQLGWTDDECIFCVDAGGMGQGALATLYDGNKRVFEFLSNATAFEPRTYHDAITEAYFNLKLMTRNQQIHLKEDQMMFRQLIDRQYRFTDNKMRLESKDEFLVRVKDQEEWSSPDRADAIALAFYPYAGQDMKLIPLVA